MIMLSWYILKMLIISGILCGYYYWALKDKVYHKWNRFYLLFTVVLSIVLPLISISLFSPSPGQGAIKVLQTFTMQDEIVITMGKKKPFVNIEWMVMAAYLLVSLKLLISFLQSLDKIRRMHKKFSATSINGIKFIKTNSQGTPFSFFNSIFWNNAIDLHTTPGRQIFNHEVAHVTEKHSYDKVFLNVLLMIFWVNPFFWLIRKELDMIHEFVADNMALEDGDTQSFAAMVLATVYAGKQFPITNNFFHSPIKRRLKMLTKSKNAKVNYVTRLLALPLATLIFIGISCKVKSNSATETRDADSAVTTLERIDTNSTQDSTPVMYYQGKKIVSLDVITPGGKAFANITYDDGSSEKITLTEAESRGFDIPPPPPPPPPPPTVKVQFTPPRVVKDDKIFVKVEKEASFPGGQESWQKYIKRAIEKSLNEFTEKDFGTCIVRFVVDKNGNVSDVEATTMKESMLAKIAVDAIRKGPKWIPATNGGEKVSAYRLQPVTLTNPE